MKYKLIFTLYFVLLLTVPGCSLQQSCSDDPECTSVLFIGNSYTYVNDLPDMFNKLSTAGGHRVETGMAATGGWFLSSHANSSDTFNQIRSSEWDYVVLQEQSQIPASEAMRVTQMYPAARTLVTQIRETGAEPIFFLTWAHRNGWPELGLPTFGNMQFNIDEGYQAIAYELHARISPVGLAWSQALQQNPQAGLWQADSIHPSVQGTYLAACVFYAAVFQESPEGLSFRNELSKEEAQWLQKIAADTVLDNKSKWNIK